MTELNRPHRRAGVAIIAAFAVALATVAAAPTSASAAGTSYYVNCGQTTNGTGTQTSPWNSLASAAAHTYVAGDSLLLARGTTCTGSLLIKNSGSSASPITIDAYGTGALPIINATGQTYAVELNNTSYLTIQNLELENSTRYGLLATTSKSGIVTGLTINGLVVHHVTGGTMDVKQTGLIVLMPGSKGSTFANTTVENVTAYDTTLWAGILMLGMYYTNNWTKSVQDITTRSTNITFRNNVVHDTQGDGIVEFNVNGGLIDHNTVYRSGQQATKTIGTPNAIWSWASNNVTVQYNEAYQNSSPAADGGAYDIDYYSSNTTVQYNYAHDNKAYCVGVFGAEKSTTTNSVVRYNVCANNGQLGAGAEGTQEIYVGTWDNGKIDGLQVYGNTFYTTASGVVGICNCGSALAFGATLPNTFQNNLVVSTVANPYGAGIAGIPWTKRGNNLYYYTGGSFSGTEAGSIYNTNPLVNGLGYHGIGRPTTQWTLQTGSPAINHAATITGAPATDFFGNPVPVAAFDIGANEAG